MSVYNVTLAPAESLMTYSPPSGNAQMFAAAGADIFDVTTASTSVEAVSTGYTSAYFEDTQIGSSTNHYMHICNGFDTPQIYDGSSFADATYTGPSLTNVAWCNTHQRRLWVGEKNSLIVYYGGINAITGAFDSFDFAGLTALGGFIMNMGTWSRDSGDGADDVAVFLTSEGEAIVYQGNDPSSATDWALIGVFRVGKPIGRRCMIKAGADLIMVTQDGFVAASTILSMDRSQTEKVALSQQINKAVNDYVRLYSALSGWEAFLYPFGTMLIFNIPTSTTSADQCVFNTITRAPCRFTGIDARCWGLLDDAAYFGSSDGSVYRFDVGQSDDGDNISGDILQAFNYFGESQVYKYFKTIEPVFQSDGEPQLAVNLCYDYNVTAQGAIPENVTAGDNLWDSATWDESFWSAGDQIYRKKYGARGKGRAAGLRIRIATNTVRPSLVATNFIWIPGGYL